MLSRALPPGGHVVIGTFAADGPERCSGLGVVRYHPPDIAEALGPSFVLVEGFRHEHRTPAGKTQPFSYARLIRR